jgi:hypothetical protein
MSTECPALAAEKCAQRCQAVQDTCCTPSQHEDCAVHDSCGQDVFACLAVKADAVCIVGHQGCLHSCEHTRDTTLQNQPVKLANERDSIEILRDAAPAVVCPAVPVPAAEQHAAGHGGAVCC